MLDAPVIQETTKVLGGLCQEARSNMAGQTFGMKPGSQVKHLTKC